jgi:hypothetical protein
MALSGFRSSTTGRKLSVFNPTAAGFWSSEGSYRPGLWWVEVTDDSDDAEEFYGTWASVASGATWND